MERGEKNDSNILEQLTGTNLYEDSEGGYLLLEYHKTSAIFYWLSGFMAFSTLLYLLTSPNSPIPAESSDCTQGECGGGIGQR